MIEENLFSRDPGVDDATWQWLLEKAEGPFATLIRSKSIFSSFEFDRKVPLMFTLNLMCTYLTGYYERNDKVRKFLDDRAEKFPEREEVIAAINAAAEFVSSMELPGNAVWWNKANFFSLITELTRQPDLMQQGAREATAKLQEFAQGMPQEYVLAAREAVGRKPQRELRGSAIRQVLAAQPIT